MPNEARIILTGSAVGAVASINQVTGAMKKVESETGGIMAKVKSHWIGLSVAATGAVMAIHKAWDMADAAARYQEQMQALDALARQYNTSSVQMVTAVKEASNGLISLSDAAAVSAKALMMGLNPDQLVQFMRVADATTNVTGQSVSQAFEQITQAAAAGQERSLKQMGVIVDLNGAYERYARGLGKTVQSLTETERQQAAVNAILGKGDQIIRQLGGATDSVADKMERLKVQIEDLKLFVGTFITRVGLALYGLFQGAASAALTLYAGLMKVGQGYEWLASKLSFGYVSKQHAAVAEQVKIDAAAAWDAAVDLATKGRDNLAALFASTEDLYRAQGAGAPGAAGPGPAEQHAVLLSQKLEMEAQYQQAVATLRKADGSSLEEQHAAELAAWDVQTAAKMQAMLESEEQKALAQDFYAAREVERAAKVAEQEAQINERRKKSEQQLWQGKVNAMMAGLQLIDALTKGKFKAILIAQKVMQARQAIASGNLAAVAALTLPPIGAGPIAGKPLAFWARLQGYLSAAAIMAETFMSPSSGPSAGGGGEAAAAPASPEQAQPQQTVVTQVRNYYFQGSLIDHDGLVRAEIEAERRAEEDNAYAY